MPPLLTMLDHAGFLLEHGDVRLATDPWGTGDAFLHGWRRQSSAPFPMDVLARATHVWFSHEHADHFSPATLRAIPDEARARMRILYQTTRDGTLRDYCRSLGFADVIELPHLAWLALGDDVRVRCGHAFGGDSWLLVEADGRRFLNLNDCIYDDDLALHDLARTVGAIDVLLAQFSVGSWLGNPEDDGWRTTEPSRALDVLRRKCRALAPRQTVPWASFFCFTHPENFHLNDALTSPAAALRAIVAGGSEPVLPYVGDRWTLGAPWSANDANVARWDRDRAACIAAGPDAPPPADVGRAALCEAAAAYVARTRAANPAWRLLRRRPVVLGFFDDAALRLRLADDGLADAPADATPDVVLAKESLLYCFRDLRGANTLLVNGRFRARDRDGMAAFFAHFAACAANRRGNALTVRRLVTLRLQLWRTLLRRRLFAAAPWAFRRAAAPQARRSRAS
jgi:L-ascorbate metabolism protein UlaG (beta-lactamase superfamily)